MGRPGHAALTLLALLVSSAVCKRSGPDWRIVHLYGGETSHRLLTSPARVQMFRIGPRDATTTAEVHAGPYPALGAPADLDPARAAELTRILGDAESFDWHRAKRDPFRPQVGVWFVRGSSVLELALDLESAQIAVYAGGQAVGAEDFDAVRGRMLEIARASLPGDAVVDSIK